MDVDDLPLEDTESSDAAVSLLLALNCGFSRPNNMDLEAVWNFSGRKNFRFIPSTMALLLTLSFVNTFA